VQVDLDGGRVVEVADVGADTLYVHDEHRASPTAAMALALMAPEPTEPTPMGVFRDVAMPMHHTAQVDGPGSRDDLAAVVIRDHVDRRLTVSGE
jgi:2-oxoglutarate ferredoxin oxidoreductase subunit beta